MAQAHNPPNFFEMPMPASIRKALAAGEITADLFDLLRAGQSLMESGQPEEAIEKFVEAHRLSGENPFTLRVIGAFLFSINLYHESLSIYLRLQELEPNELDVLHSIATLLYSMRQFEPAMEMMRGLIEQHPGEANLWLTAGLIAAETNQWDEALLFFEQSRDLDGSDVTVHMNLGWMYRLRGELDKAAAEYEIAASLSPESPSSRYNKALVHLARGEFEQGLSDYEVRTKPGSHAYVYRDIDLPVWNGERFGDERVLIGAEQGIGDQLHFATELGTLLEDLNEPVLEVEGKLVPLFQRTFPGLEVRPQLGRLHGSQLRAGYPWIAETGRHFDKLINLGSVSLYARRTRGAWPARSGGYLKVDTERSAAFAKGLAALGDRPKVGVIWKSMLSEGKRENAYAPAWEWGKLLQRLREKVTFVNLQYANAAAGIRAFREEWGVEIFDFPDLDQYKDVDGVAALCASLDFAMGAKTAPIMLAAAVGTPALALAGGTPWARPAADGHDPWLPALREAGGGIDWMEAMANAYEIASDWAEKVRSGQPILTPRQAPFT